MIRKLLIFVVLLAGGLYLLTWLTDGPIWKEASKQTETKLIQAPPAGVTLESRKKGQVDKPQVKVSGTGALTLRGKPITYRIGKGHELDLPTYVLTAKNHRIRNNGIYDLDNVRVEFLRPMRKGNTVVGGVPVYLTSTSMRVTIDTEGQVQRLDQSQEMDFTDVVVHSRLGQMRKGQILDEQANGTMQLESAHLSGYFRDEILDVYTKDEKEKVTVTLGSERGDMRLTGRGVRGTVQTGALAKKSFSEIRLLEDIEMVGTGDYAVSITGKGPLQAKGGPESDWFLELEQEVRIKVQEARADGRGLLEGAGDRVRVWVGSTDLVSRAGGRPTRSLSDVSLQGHPARLTVSSQIIESRQIHVALGASGEPERLATEGLTRLWLRDRHGHPVGKFRGRDGILWTREGRQAAQVLSGMGIDFLGSSLALLDPLWPEDVIQILGPAAYESEGDLKGLGEDVEKATAEEGLLIYAAWRYGNLVPFMIEGLGDVRIRGRLQQDGTLVARGNRGFTLLREMTTGLLHGAMGELGGEDGHAFQVRMERHAADPKDEEGRLVDIIEGKGWIRFSGRQVRDGEGRGKTSVGVEFHAGLQENLAWHRSVAGEETRIDGIKTSSYTQDGQGGYGLHLAGIPLIVTATQENIRATAEFCDKTDGNPWSLRGQIEPVNFHLEGKGKRSKAHLRAAEVRFRRIPVLDVDQDQPLLLPIQALGKVRLEVDFAKQRGKKRRLELDCNEFRYLPIVAAPMLESLVGDLLGAGGDLLAGRLLGNHGGFVRALGSVELTLVELGGDRGKDVRRLSGEDLVFESDTFSSRILPKPGGLVRVEIEEENRARLWARAEIARTHGADMDLGEKTGGRVEIWMQDPKDREQVFHLGSAAPVIYRSEVAERRITPEDCGEAPDADPYKGRYGIVEFPGPVLGKQLNTTAATRFEVACSERLILQLRTQERVVDAGGRAGREKWILPEGFDRMLAKGKVRLLYQEIEARGDALGLAGGSGWFRLSSKGPDPVLLGFGEEYHAKCHPGIAYNLRTGEMSSGRFLIKSEPIPAEGTSK